MSLQDRIINQFSDSIQTHTDALTNLAEVIEYASQRMLAALLNDKKIFCCGNGVCATSAQLLSAIMLNQYERNRPALPVIVLSPEVASLTAIANDYQFNDIFARPLRALGQSEELLVVYSTLGNCTNLTKAISAAHDKQMTVIALMGGEGGLMTSVLNETDIEIRVPSNSKTRVHETHVLITHCLCDLIDFQLFGG